MSKASETVVFEYNESGLRVKKIATSTGTTHYTLHGKNIVHLTNGSNTLHFFYDAAGKPAMVEWNNGTNTQKFAYIHNLQGDIIALIDDNGTKVVSYTYDAWGKPLSTSGTLANTLGKLNPFRYRGYVFDEETGLYYVSSRYYDPEIGRFMNADGIVACIGVNEKGYNLFAYCFDNPVIMDDQIGNWPKWIKNTVKWVAKNIVKPVVKTVQKTLSKVDATYSRGINVSGTPSAFIFNLQAGISIDTKGNVAIQGSAGGGVTGGSPGASITAYQSVTNAPSIDKLEGLGYQIGGSVGVPVYGVPLAAGGDFNIIPDSALNTTYLGATTNVGFGTPGGEFHIEWGETATWNATRFNIFDVAEDVYIKIMEW